MTQENPRNKKSHWLPVFLTFLLLGACCWRLWVLWSEHQEHAARIEKAGAVVEGLEQRRDSLKSVLELPPCEARETLEKLKAKPRLSESAAASPPLAANEPESHVDAIEKGCVFIVSLGKKGISTGSGFFVDPDHIVTNRHVVSNGGGAILVTSKALGQPARAKVVAVGKGQGNDYALLKTALPPEAGVCILPFAQDVKKTQKVGAWGFPNLVGKNDPKYVQLLKNGNLSAVPELSYSEGVVSALLDRTPGLIVHTAPISPGNSGGPLVNDKGQVVGINTMITLDEDSYRQASIALNAKDLSRFLASQGISAPTQ